MLFFGKIFHRLFVLMTQPKKALPANTGSAFFVQNVPQKHRGISVSLLFSDSIPAMILI